MLPSRSIDHAVVMVWAMLLAESDDRCDVEMLPSMIIWCHMCDDVRHRFSILSSEGSLTYYPLVYRRSTQESCSLVWCNLAFRLHWFSDTPLLHVLLGFALSLYFPQLCCIEHVGVRC